MIYANINTSREQKTPVSLPTVTLYQCLFNECQFNRCQFIQRIFSVFQKESTMRFIQKTILTNVLWLTLLGQISFAEIYEIDDLTQAKDIAEQAASAYGMRNVLVVFDIDNTILANKVSIGSDQWFEWQAHLIKTGDLSNAIATTTGELYRKGALLYSISPMRQTQQNASEILHAINDQGFWTMALTARSPANRDATLRELATNAFEFSTNAPIAHPARPGHYMPLHPQYPQQSGLSHEEVQQFKLNSPRKVSYEQGVMMVAGQHKGAMLRTVLYASTLNPKAVVFVDDKVKNLTHVEEALTPLGIEVHALRYSGEDSNVEAFHASDKSTEIAAWQQLEQTLVNIFPIASAASF